MNRLLRPIFTLFGDAVPRSLFFFSTTGTTDTEFVLGHFLLMPAPVMETDEYNQWSQHGGFSDAPAQPNQWRPRLPHKHVACASRVPQPSDILQNALRGRTCRTLLRCL